mmetsp:Transcript_11755/g.13378  ORF Transcript_11755/g.13378 Transcript_11755/m.13378 type:complete len:488 (+) Transcript_11755:357-1820(+)
MQHPRVIPVIDDFALAMQLQEDEQAQYDAFCYRELRHNEGSKVTIKPRFSAVPINHNQGNEKILYTADDAHDFPVLKNDKQTSSSRKPIWINRPKHLKGQGGNEEIITKHDPEICGRRNVEELSKNLSESYITGDLTMRNHNLILSNNVSNSLKSQLKKQKGTIKGVGRTVEKDSKQTHAKGLDQKTRLILQSMVNIGILNEVNGTVRTGKEAVVYHAEGPFVIPPDVNIVEMEEPDILNDSKADQSQTREYAVKVFKTTISEFKRRSDYVDGDHRFRSIVNLSRQNPRLILQVWAERELKNLVRIHRAKIPCPRPVRLVDNVLLLTFLGRNGWAAPQLRETNLSRSKYIKCYVQVGLMMRAMFHSCSLIHADLSEYNILYHESRCYIIDVGQAVLKDHEKAMEFLLRDCVNIISFFGKKEIENLVSPNELLNFVLAKTDSDSTSGNIENMNVSALSSTQVKAWEHAKTLGEWSHKYRGNITQLFRN